MTTEVWKFRLPLSGESEVCMQKGAEILHVGVQNKLPYLWARIDPDAPEEVRRFRVAGTGHTLEANVGKHIGTFLIPEENFVGHIFEMED